MADNWFFSKGYKVVYRFTDTLCFIVGITVPTSPRNSVVCALCLNSSDLRSDVFTLLGRNMRPAEETVFSAYRSRPQCRHQMKWG